MGLGLDFEDVEGDNKKATILNIVTYYQRHNILSVFVEQLRFERPQYKWPDVVGE